MTTSGKDLVKVSNRCAGKVIIRIPDRGIRRELMPGQAVYMTRDEVEALSYANGGLSLIQNYLFVDDSPILDHLNINREPEYYMDATKIADLIKNGTLDEFKDFLDFAPAGAIDILKDLSVQLPLNDYDKRHALQEMTGFDVDAAIKHAAEEKAPDDGKKAEEESKKVRRTTTTATAPARRVVKKATTEVEK